MNEPIKRKLHLTVHAIERFRERIGADSDEDAIVEILRCLTTAKPKCFLKMYKQTYYIPTDRCLFVCSLNAIVTVLPRGSRGQRVP